MFNETNTLSTQSLHYKTLNARKIALLFLFFFLSIDTVAFTFLRSEVNFAIYIKFLFPVILIISIFQLYTWNRHDKVCAIVFLILFLKLIIESLIVFGSVLQYPTVVAVIFPFLYVFFVKNLFKKLKVDIIKTLVLVILISYVTFMVFFGRRFSINITPIPIEEAGPSFTGDTRILGPGPVLLMTIPQLYFLNKLLKKYSSKVLAGFVISSIIILIHQHRTTWITSFCSMMLFMFMQNRNIKMLKRSLLFVFVFVVVITLLVFFVPTFNEIFVERLSVIFNPLDDDTTSGWRYIQILSYINYFLQRPIFGWTFEGFILPNPFADNSWEDGSGQHFHDAYIEILFYFGITGLLLKYYPLYKIAKTTFSKKLSDNSKILTAFCVVGFIYSFSYVPPLAFWAVVGLCLYYLDNDFRVKKIKAKTQLSSQ